MGSTDNQPRPSTTGTSYSYDRSPTVGAAGGNGSSSQHRISCAAAAPGVHVETATATTNVAGVITGYDETIIHKTILVGDSGVGKTSLLVQFDQKKFQAGSFAATVGIGFTNKVVTVDGAKIKLQIWDTAGQERFRSITHAYYRDAHALLLLYDVTSKTSFDNISAWLAEINEYAQDDVVIMLIGNKADVNGERTVRKEDGIGVAQDYGVSFMETSAKTGQNVENAFISVARDLMLNKTRSQARDGEPGLQITSSNSEQQSAPDGTFAIGCCS